MNPCADIHAYDFILHPELASVKLLRETARVTAAALAGSIDGLCFQDALVFHRDDPRKLIGHLLIDRCREIAELTIAYQQADSCPRPDDCNDFGSELPF